MRRLQPVIWAKGTFLSPQHLQAQDIFHEDLLQFRLDGLNLFPWGFRTLKLNREALAAGNLKLDAASGLMKDGLVFDIPGSDPAPVPKQLETYFNLTRDTIKVYLAVPPWREGKTNVATTAGQADTEVRYLAETLQMRDENATQGGRQLEKPVRIARKNFRLLVESEVPEGTEALAVARVRKLPNGKLELDDSFVPPLIDFDASDRLKLMAGGLVESLTAKSASLSLLRRHRNIGLADFSATDVANFWLLYTVNTYLPPMRHLSEVRHGHPEGLFNLMNALAGALTTFSTRIAPKDLPLYDHNELGERFTDLESKIRFLLDSVIPSNVVSLPLKLTANAIYSTPLSDDKYLQDTRFYLAVKAEIPKDELISKTLTLIKACSQNHIELLVSTAQQGVTLRHLPMAPAAIPVKLDYQYFGLNQDGAEWEAIRRSRNFATWVPSDFRNPQLELIIVMPQS